MQPNYALVWNERLTVNKKKLKMKRDNKLNFSVLRSRILMRLRPRLLPTIYKANFFFKQANVNIRNRNILSSDLNWYRYGIKIDWEK
jgi:hypothetical protein